MSNIVLTKRMIKNEAGFTLIELMIASLMSLVILGLLAHVFRSQQKEFDTHTELNTMQANGRGATEFIARSVQNAGFNVKRGTRFLSASDHSITAVYDSDNDAVIQNNEVITYTIANTWDGTINDDFSFVSYFDVDGDGTIDSTENPLIDVEMTASGPPFNLYKVTPDATGTGIERNLIAKNIDNMIIKYYDRDANLLPIMNDTDDDGVGDVAFDADNDGNPDSGNWTFQIPMAELNDIRKVEIEILARSRNPSPREVTSSGNYVPGSLAAVTSGSTAYSDTFSRDDFTAQMAPRNLVMAPWGNIDIVATPATVDCPTPGAVTATLLDKNGQAVPATQLAFTATGTGITLGSPTANTDSNGDRTTTVVFDYASPFLTSTVSASAQVIDITGESRPVYNATPIGFTFGGGNFNEPFDGSQTIAWDDLVTGTGFEIPPGQEYFTSSLPGPGVLVGSVNGCAPWQDYIVQTNVSHTGTFNNDDYYGVILRHQDQDNYYWARMRYLSFSPGFYLLEVGRTVAGTESVMASIDILSELALQTPSETYTTPGTYTLKAQVQGTEIKAKFWKPADPTDPGADEPLTWQVTGNHSSFTSGKFGVIAKDDIFQFDDLSLENAPPIL
jgi:Tfp pilus assembly protein PilE